MLALGMEAISAEITSMAQNADQATRKDILDQLRNLAFTLESPGDTVQRLLYLVWNHNLGTQAKSANFVLGAEALLI